MEIPFIDLNLKKDIFKTLIPQVLRHNVIPLIGNKFVRMGQLTSKEFIIQTVAKCFGIIGEFHSYDQLLNHPKFLNDPEANLHVAVERLFAEVPEYFNCSQEDSLRRFLSLKNPITNEFCFPFVITTTIDPVVENVMNDIHQRKVRVLKFRKSQNCDDIQTVSDLTTPTIYYLFGSPDTNYYNANSEPEFVLTDFDYLSVLRKWLMPIDSQNKSGAYNFSTILPSKFVLALGCDYQDWLFRFIWYALKQEAGLVTGKKEELGAFSIDDCEETLVDFLKRTNTFTHIDDMDNFVTKLEANLNSVDVTKHSVFDYPASTPHVFISYSRANSDVAEKLYSILKDKGVKVWYDKESLGAGVNFRKQIEISIQNSTLFVPILSQAILQQSKEMHVYRKEWDWAVEKDKTIGGYRYIIPLCEKSFIDELYNAAASIPKNLIDLNASTYETKNLEKDIKEFAKKLIEILEKEYGIEIRK